MVVLSIHNQFSVKATEPFLRIYERATKEARFAIRLDTGRTNEHERFSVSACECKYCKLIEMVRCDEVGTTFCFQMDVNISNLIYILVTIVSSQDAT